MLDGLSPLKFNIVSVWTPGPSHERVVPGRTLVGLAALLFIFNTPAGAADPHWRKVTDDDGVTAWTQEAGSGLPLARATTVIAAPFCEVLAVIRDVARHCEWLADCVETRVARRTDWARIDMYLRIKGYPWVGVADRDALLATNTVIERPGESAEVTFSVIDDPTQPLGTVTVHMPKLNGSYRLSREGRGTQVDYRFAADLGGWVPGWVGTRTVEQLPWRTLVGLRQQVAKEGAGYRPEIASWPTPCTVQ
jgi:hypothetical protein